MQLRAPFAIGLAYGILGQIFFALAAFGVLTRGAVTSVLIAGLLLALFRLRDVRMPSALILIGSLPAFVLALYPPVGWDGTAYHLPYARLFAEAGALVFADTLRFPVFPQLAEMWFAAALLVANDATAQLTQWLTLVVTAAATSAIAAELGGSRARPFAAALWLGTPLAIYLAGNAYVDCALTMSVTLAFAAWLIWRRTGHPGWIALAGAFAGMAAATKYHGLFFLIVLLVAAAFMSWRAALFFAIPASLFAVPWYARIAHETGNPIFPFLGGIFGHSEWHPLIERNPGDFLGIPGNPLLATVRRAWLEPIALGLPPQSPWIVLLLPVALAAAIVERRLRFPLAIAAAWIVLMSPLDWRFMLPVVPLICAAIALMVERLVSSAATPVAALIAAFLAPGFLWGSILIAKFGPIPRTAAQREAFIAHRIPVYRALQSIGESTAYVLVAPNAAYYCGGRCLGEHLGPYRYELVGPLLGDPPRLAALLRRFGVRYLVAERKWNVQLPFRRVYSDADAEVFEVP